MAWVKLDDQFPDHHKLAECGYLAPLAGWLYICGLCYCNRQLTDGRIQRQHVHRLAHFKHVQFERATIGQGKDHLASFADDVDIDELADLLVGVGLWDQPDGPTGDYWVHDYLHYQPSKADVQAQRAAVAERVGRHRRGRNSVSNGVTQRVTNGVSNGVSTPRPDPVPDPVVPSVKNTDGTARVSPLGGRVNPHRSHACCGRVCLPAVLFDELVRLHGGPEAEAEPYVRAWYTRREAALPPGPIGDDAFALWRGFWAADHPSHKPAKKDANTAALDEWTRTGVVR